MNQTSTDAITDVSLQVGEVVQDDSESGDGAPFFVQFKDGTRKWCVG